jgi:hypothetical protein
MLALRRSVAMNTAAAKPIVLHALPACMSGDRRNSSTESNEGMSLIWAEGLSVYKKLLRAAKTYPSKKRDNILQDIRKDFRVSPHQRLLFFRRLSICFKLLRFFHIAFKSTSFLLDGVQRRYFGAHCVPVAAM